MQSPETHGVSHLLLKMRCIFFTEQPYTDQGSAPGPPKPCFPYLMPAVWGFGLRLLISQGFLGAKAGHPDQRFGTGTALPCANALCQNSRIRLSPNSGTVRRFPPWNVFPPLKPAFFFPNSAPLNSGLWLGAFGKVWLFRCQSGIRGLWLTAFGKLGLFMCQSTFAIRFCQRNGVFFCKGTKLEGLYCDGFFRGTAGINPRRLSGHIFCRKSQNRRNRQSRLF